MRSTRAGSPAEAGRRRITKDPAAARSRSSTRRTRFASTPNPWSRRGRTPGRSSSPAHAAGTPAPSSGSSTTAAAAPTAWTPSLKASPVVPSSWAGATSPGWPRMSSTTTSSRTASSRWRSARMSGSCSTTTPPGSGPPSLTARSTSGRGAPAAATASTGTVWRSGTAR